MCSHENFKAKVAINRLEDSGRFMADITVECSDCGLPFEFLGLTMGLDLSGATCSPDGLEARIAISPKGARPNPLQAAIHGTSRFDA